MKARIFNGQTKSNTGKTMPMPSGGRRCTSAMEGSDRMRRLLHIAHEMGGPLNVVLGRMKFLLGRDTDKETARCLKAIMSQAEQLVAMRQQLLDEARAVREKTPNTLVWEVEVVTAENTVMEGHIDAGSGAVIDVEEEKAIKGESRSSPKSIRER